jgi:hypothetical protein
MANIKHFPQISEISPRFFWSDIHQEDSVEEREFYEAISSLDTNGWDRLAEGDSHISDEIFSKLATTATGHSGGSWACLVAYYREIAKNGIPDRFLLKNEIFWIRGYYMPDYFSKFLFAAGAAGAASIIAALKFN